MNPQDVIISPGMDVYSSDNEKIGTVSHVWPTAEDTSTGVSTTGVFQVNHGGILGLGTQHLHVPYVDVQACVPGDRVTLDCSKAECAERYQNRPGGVQEGG